jgi:hypothetical protein
MKIDVNSFYQGMKIWTRSNQNQIISYTVKSLPQKRQVGWRASDFYIDVDYNQTDQLQAVINITRTKVYFSEIDCAKAIFKSNKSKLDRRFKAIKKLQDQVDNIADQQGKFANKYGFY